MKLLSFGTSARQRNALMKMNSKIDLDFRLNVKIYTIFFASCKLKFNTVYFNWA